MPKPIVVVGSVNIDLVARVDAFPLAGQTVLVQQYLPFGGRAGQENG